jgi:hypothetical protein
MPSGRQIERAVDLPGSGMCDQASVDHNVDSFDRVAG